jgi:glutathione S-transferase
MNPSRKIPTLVGPGGETLTETAAIAITLAERFPNGGLLPPRGTSDRDQALRWLVFVATELYPIVEINDYPERFAVDPASTDAVRELARAHWRHRWIIVEEAVTGSPWLLASGFCVADVYLGVVSRWAQQDVWRSDHLPKIEAIAAGLADHPIVGPVWRRHFDRDG